MTLADSRMVPKPRRDFSPAAGSWVETTLKVALADAIARELNARRLTLTQAAAVLGVSNCGSFRESIAAIRGGPRRVSGVGLDRLIRFADALGIEGAYAFRARATLAVAA